MASSRLPGPICASKQPPIDFRTSQLAPTPPPGPVGAHASESSLETADIETLKLFEKGLKYRSLEELQHLRFKNEQLYRQALREFGPHSWHVTFWASSIAILDKHIALAHSTYGKAKERLKEAIEAVKKGTPVKDDDVKNAIADLLGEERQSQLLGAPSASEGESAMEVVAEALTVVSQVKNKQFKELLEKAKRPGANVTDDQIKKELEPILGLERQKQLLGIDDQSSETMSLVCDALNFVHERRTSGLSDLIDKAKSGNQKVTKEQIQKQVVLVLESERQRQLMGVTDPIQDQQTGKLLDEAGQVM